MRHLVQRLGRDPVFLGIVIAAVAILAFAWGFQHLGPVLDRLWG